MYIYIYIIVNITDVAAATPQTLQYLSVYVLLTFRYTSIHIHFFLLHNPFTIHPHPSMSMAGPPHLLSIFSGVNSPKAPNFDNAKHRLRGKTCCACRRFKVGGWNMMLDVDFYLGPWEWSHLPHPRYIWRCLNIQGWWMLTSYPPGNKKRSHIPTQPAKGNLSRWLISLFHSRWDMLVSSLDLVEVKL